MATHLPSVNTHAEKRMQMESSRNDNNWNFMDGAFVDNDERKRGIAYGYQEEVRGNDLEEDYCTCAHSSPTTHPSPVQPESPYWWAAPGAPPSFPIPCPFPTPQIPSPSSGSYDYRYRQEQLPFPEPASSYGHQTPLTASFTSGNTINHFYGNYISGLEHIEQQTVPSSHPPQPTRPVVYVRNHFYTCNHDPSNIFVDSTPDYSTTVNTKDNTYCGYDDSKVDVHYGATV